MKVQRYTLKNDAAGEPYMGPDTSGSFVYLNDHEADKAEAVAAAVEKATAEMRAELARLWEGKFRRSEVVYSNGLYTVLKNQAAMQIAERLVELGTWERVGGSDGRYIAYRPIEPQDSKASE